MANPNRLTSQECIDLIKAESGTEISASTWRSYVARGRRRPRSRRSGERRCGSAAKSSSGPTTDPDRARAPMCRSLGADAQSD